MRVPHERQLRAERLLHRNAVAQDETGGQRDADLLDRRGERRPGLQWRFTAHCRRAVPRPGPRQLRRRKLPCLQHVQVCLQVVSSCDWKISQPMKNSIPFHFSHRTRCYTCIYLCL